MPIFSGVAAILFFETVKNRNIHYSFNFRKKIFFARKFFQLYLYIETTSADKFTQNGILVDPIARHWKEIVQEFQQTLCL